MGNIYGYARVSTKNQVLDLQIDSLLKTGVERENIFTDENVSGAKRNRPGFDRLLKIIQPGDTIISWKLDRIGRSVSHLSELLNQLNERGIYIRTISDGVDTGTKMGKMMFHLLSTLAEFERDIIMERIEAGKAVARANGVKFGPKYKLEKQHLDDIGEKLKTMTVKQVSDFFDVSERTIYRLKSIGLIK